MVADQAAAAGAAGRTVPPYARDAVAVVEAAGSDADSGLTQAEVASRLSTYGTNQIVSEKPPSVWAVALLQLRDPMNIMLVAVTCGEHSHWAGVDRDRRGVADPSECGPRYAAGAHGEGERRRPVQDAGAAGQGCTRRRGALGAGIRSSSWRHRVCRGRGYRARRRPHRTVRDTRGTGGGTDWRERADREGCGSHWPQPMSRSATGRTCCSRTPPSPEEPAQWW